MTTKLDELEALSKAATPGPWVEVSDCNRFAVYSRIADMDVVTSQCRRYVASQRDHLGSTRADAELIAAMRNSIDDLLKLAKITKMWVEAHESWDPYEGTSPIEGECAEEARIILDRLK